MDAPLFSGTDVQALLPEFSLVLGIIVLMVLPNLGDGRWRVPFLRVGIPFLFGGRRWNTERQPSNPVDRILNMIFSRLTAPMMPFVYATIAILAALFFALDSRIPEPIFAAGNEATIVTAVGGLPMLAIDSFSRTFEMLSYAAILLALAATFHRMPSTSWSRIQRTPQRGAAEDDRQQRLLDNRRQADFYILVLMAALGMSFVALAQNLFVLVLGVELAGMASYVMVGFLKETKEGSEAGLKYFIVGATSSAVGLYGVSLLYLWSGTLQFTSVGAPAGSTSLQDAWVAMPTLQALPLVGLGLTIVGFGFKVAAAPFHLAAPDAYSGAAAPVAGLLATASKAMGIVGLMRLLVVVALPGGTGSAAWLAALGLISAVTMTWGNIAAVGSRNPKRMLAYSSVAHAGYLLAGITAIGAWRWASSPSQDAADIAGLIGAAIIVHLVVLVAIKYGAFLVISAMEMEGGGHRIEDLAGLARCHPLLATTMLMFMLALAGVPPFSGFMSKMLLVLGIVELGLGDLAIGDAANLWEAITAVHWVFWLGLIVLLNSAVSLYYYLRIGVVMFLDEPEGRPQRIPSFRSAPLLYLALGACAVGAILFGVWIDPLLGLAKHAWEALGVSG